MAVFRAKSRMFMLKLTYIARIYITHWRRCTPNFKSKPPSIVYTPSATKNRNFGIYFQITLGIISPRRNLKIIKNIDFVFCFKSNRANSPKAAAPSFIWCIFLHKVLAKHGGAQNINVDINTDDALYVFSWVASMLCNLNSMLRSHNCVKF